MQYYVVYVFHSENATRLETGEVKARITRVVARSSNVPLFAQHALTEAQITQKTDERALAHLRAVEPAPPVERRKRDDPQLSRGQRASDVPLVMNGEIAFLTPAGFIETASSLALILKFLDLHERRGD